MPDDWMSQQISNPDEVDEEKEREKTEEATEEVEEERGGFAKNLRTLLATNTVESLEVDVVRDNVDDCDDVEALKKAAEVEEREEVISLYEKRISELDLEVDDADSSDTDESGENTDSEGEEEVSGMFGGESTESTQDESEPSEEASEVEEEEDDYGVDVDGTSDGKIVASTKDIPFDSLAPDAVTVDEASQREKRWTIEVWGQPGLGKSHFGMSGISPVCVIDTEGKADQLAHKFDGSEYGDPFIFEPSNYDEAVDSLNQAIDLLDKFRSEYDVIGTIVVDSMSIMWEWSQQKYVNKFYPSADGPEDVELQTGFGSGKSDWKQIKNYHNSRFRQIMLDTPYHLIWTAMAEDDYDAQMQGNRNAMKPSGENKNPYKVDEVLRLREGKSGETIGELQKSGKVKHRYTGLRYPTFEKHSEVVNAIDEAESNNRDMASVEGRYEIRVVEGNPQYINGDDD